ncbi:MAG: MFS transporter [Candidatus Spyradocola sp.]|nr:MFS transporter [Candidatus Spyradocola sp.]
MRPTYRTTKLACYGAIISQAIQNNLPALLFVVFQQQYGISYEMLGRLILMNFVTQLCVDMISIKLAEKFGYRACLIGGQSCIAVGLILLSVLPSVLPPYIGLSIAVILMAVGGGLAEVLVSPTIEAMPGDEKAAAMSMLHSFYCWGQVATVLGSTLLLFVIGRSAWQVLPLCWVIVPACSALLFVRAPFAPVVGGEGGGMKLGTLLRTPAFLVAMLIMVCAGASELVMSQWASTFAEKALGVSKVIGDLAGPCMFAVLMGLGRMIYGRMGSRLPLKKCLMGCGLLCVACYLTAALSGNPVAALAGCAVCGFSVSIMWPGALSMSAARFPTAGTALFAILAVMGDLGCSVGPWLAGLVSDGAQAVPQLTQFAAQAGLTAEQLGLKAGLLLGTVFPVTLFVSTMFVWEKGKEKES